MEGSAWEVGAAVSGWERAEFTLPCRGAAVAATNDVFGGSDVQPPCHGMNP